MKNSSWLLFGFPISLKKSGESAIVVRLSGEATYHPASGDNIAIQEGSVLAASGELELGPDARVTLFYDGKRHTLDTEGRHDLSQALKSDAGSVKLKGGFAKKFEEELVMAFTTRGSGPEKPGGIGWGTHSIIPVTPVDTTVNKEPVLFIWADRRGLSDTAYSFQLFRDGSDDHILQATLSQNRISVDLTAFDPLEGDKFYWMVSSGEERSEKAYFIFTWKDEKAGEALQKVKEENIYKEADDKEKILMEAVALKDAGLSQHALQRLRKAASRFPDNKLIEGMTDNLITQLKQQ